MFHVSSYQWYFRTLNSLIWYSLLYFFLTIIFRFSDDCELMTGKRPNYYMMFCWKYAAPVTMGTILITSLLRLLHQSDYEAWNLQEVTFWTVEFVSTYWYVHISFYFFYFFLKNIKATIERLKWPSWALFVALVLILASAMWIPLVAFLRSIGRPFLSEEEPSWFPADDLRDYHGITPHKLSKIEKVFFRMKESYNIDSNNIWCWRWNWT